MDDEELTRFASKMHLVICVLALLTPVAQSQRICQNYDDLFVSLVFIYNLILKLTLKIV